MSPSTASTGATDSTGSAATLFDVDNHYYETRDCFTRHIEPAARGGAVRVERAGDGSDRIFVGATPCVWIDGVFGFDRTAGPGTLAQQLRAEFTDAYETDVEEDIRPEYRDRDARLARLDAQGIEAALLFPSLGVCVEPYMADDPQQTYANLRAFNRWLEEDWGYAYAGRLFAAPMLSMIDADLLVGELERVLALGARVLCLRPGPAFGRSPADPHFDAFWARVEEAGAVVAYHSGNAGYTGFFSPLWGEEASPAAHRMSAFQWVTCFADRPIMDTLAALVLHNLFGRFPRLRVLSVENGAGWAPYLYRTLDRMVGMGRNGPWIGGRLDDRPSRILRQHVWISPFPEEDPGPLVATVGERRVVFGSDFPHPEGLAEPATYRERLSALDSETVERILAGNARELLGD
jgi:predicted TIM-barrel fold metal-dependent hydrolase